MDEWIVPAICGAGLVMLGLRARARDAAFGLRYWQPWRVMMVGGGAALFAVIVAVQIWAGPLGEPTEGDPPHPVSAE